MTSYQHEVPDGDLARLARRARRGDHGAFRRLVEVLGPVYHRHAVSIVGAPDLADDIVQQAFVRAHERMAELTGRFDGWVFRIVSNLCKDHVRNIRSTQHDSYEQDDLASSLPTPDRVVEVKELRDALARAVDRLPARYREAFLRHHLGEESYESIGTALGTTAGAVKMRVHRAREQLQQMLAAHVA